MLKSRLGHSVWESFVSKFANSRRRALRTNRKQTVAAETLENRVVLAATTNPVSVSYNSATETLTLTSLAGATNEVVSVKAGSDFTDILVNGKFLTHMNGVSSADISTITFDAGAGTGDTLSISGIDNAGLTVDLTGVEKLQLNVTTTGVTDVDSDAAVILLASNVGGGLDLTTAAGGVTQSGKVTVSGDTVITAATSINLNTVGNSFGDLTFTGTDVTINEAGPVSLGGPSTATGFLKITSTGEITDNGNELDVTGATTLTSNGNAINLTATDSTFGGLLTLKGTNITLTNDDATDTQLGAITATGSFTLTSASKVLHDGTLGTTGNITVGGLAKITATNENILLTSGSNNFGSLDLNGANVSVVEKSATTLAAIVADDGTTGGNLTITSSGAITDTGVITVVGNTVLTATGNKITLDTATSTFGGTLKLTGTDITIVDHDADTALDDVVAKGFFTLTTDNGAGDVTQVATKALTISGKLTVNATQANVTLGNANNKFGSISITGVNVTVVEKDASDLSTTTATGNFSLTSGGAVTDSGVVDVTGTTTISAVGKAITLDQLSTFEDVITLTGSNATLTNINTTATGSTLGNVTLTGFFTLDSTGDVIQNASTTITVPGKLTINAHTSAIELGIAASTTANFGSMNLIAGTAGSLQVEIQEDSASDLGNITILGDFTLTHSAGVFAVTDSGTISVTGTTTITTATTADITLDSQSSTYTGAGTNEDLNLTGKNVKVFDADGATKLGAITATGTLTVNAAGAITDTALITVTGAASFKTAGADIILDNDTNSFSSTISLVGESAVVDTTGTANAVTLATTTLNGTLTIDANGAVTDVGTVKAGDTDIDSTGVITLDSASNVFGVLTLDGTAITIVEYGDTDLGAVTATTTLSVKSSGAISDTGEDIVVGDDTTLTATGGNIELLNATSTFGDQLFLTGASITITDDDGETDLGKVVTTDAISGNGDFTLTSSGDVVQSGNITVIGDATITAGAGMDITLDGTGGAKNKFGTLTFTGDDVSIKEEDTTDLSPASASVAGGTLTIFSNGDINSTAKVSADGDTTLTAGGAAGTGSIDLSNAADFFGDLTINGGNVIISDHGDVAGSTTLKASAIKGDFTLISGGAVDQTAAITVVGTIDVTAAFGGAAQGITLDNAGNEFSTIVVQNGSVVSFVDSDGDTTLGSPTVTSVATTSFTLDNTAGGNITDEGKLDFGATTIDAGAGNITLDYDQSHFDTLDLVGNNIEVYSYQTAGSVTEDTLHLGTINAAGTLTIYAINSGAVSTGYNILQDTIGGLPGPGTITVGSDVFFNAGKDLTLDSGNNYTRIDALFHFIAGEDLISF